MNEQLAFLDDQPAPAARPQEYLIPIGGRRVTCRSCGAAMVWTRTERGAAMPLSVASIEERDGRQFAIPHWHDCPSRNQHRRST